MPTRVLLLVTDLEIGGTPRVVRDLAIRLRGDNVTTAVACLAPWGPVAGELEQAGVRVIPLNATGAHQLPQTLWKLSRLARQFDVIVSFLVHANAVAALSTGLARRTRLIQSIQTTQPWPRWHWVLQGLIERAADKIVVPSQSVANVAHDWSHIPKERLEVIPNAIDVEGFVDLNLTPFQTATTRVGFIGRLDPVKRVPDLVKAVSKLHNAELHVFGEGEARSEIERIAADYAMDRRTVMHGQIASPVDALRQIDLLVLPSDAEGFGLVLIEAMAAGIPVVATDVPGIRDVVWHESTGLLVPARQPDLLAAAIERMRSSPELRAGLTRHARDVVRRRYTWPAVLEQYRKLLGK